MAIYDLLRKHARHPSVHRSAVHSGCTYQSLKAYGSGVCWLQAVSRHPVTLPVGFYQGSSVAMLDDLEVGMDLGVGVRRLDAQARPQFSLYL